MEVAEILREGVGMGVLSEGEAEEIIGRCDWGGEDDK